MKKASSLNAQIGILTGCLKSLNSLKNSNLPTYKLSLVEQLTYCLRDLQYTILKKPLPYRSKQVQRMSIYEITQFISEKVSILKEEDIAFSKELYNIKQQLVPVKSYIDLHSHTIGAIPASETDNNSNAKKFLDEIKLTSYGSKFKKFLSPDIFRAAAELLEKEQQIHADDDLF
jgi:hypothetical protein